MTIYNIIDARKRKYRWEKITVIVEPTVHDNSVKDSDQVTGEGREYPGMGYHEHDETSLNAAIAQWQAVDYPVTLYLYDLGDGIRLVMNRV